MWNLGFRWRWGQRWVSFWVQVRVGMEVQRVVLREE